MRRSVGLSLAITVVCALPVFLLGALSTFMREDLGFSVTMLGVFIAIFRGSAATVAVPLGRLADRIGPAASMRAAASIAALAALGTAVAVRSWPALIVTLIIAGVANALGQASANLMLARRVRTAKLGVAFGLKQSALPIASLLAGLTVPLLAATVGWRWAFAIAGCCAVAIAVIAQPGRDGASSGDGAATPPPATTATRLSLLVVGMLFAMAAATTLSAFTVESAVAAGVSSGAAGLLLTVGGVCAVAVRLASGALADRRKGRHLQVVSRMIATGVIGFVLLGFGTWWMLVIGTIIGFSFGWGYNGVFWYAIVRLNEAAPGRATGAVLVGGSIGGLAGPMAFGLLADTFGYAVSWRVAGAWAAIGALTIHLARRQLLAGGMAAASDVEA